MRTIARISFFSMLFCLFCQASQAQTASFHVYDSAVSCVNKIMRYQATCTPGYTSLRWNLGYGFLPATSADTASAVYSTPGTYHVTLVTYYGTDSAVATMDVVKPANVNVSFSADDTDICSGTTVHFTNASTSVVPGAITYEWLINGGTTAVANPTYTFTNTTNTYYDIRLRGTNANGCADELTLHSYIHVFALPNVGFKVTRGHICRRPFVTATIDTSSGDGPLSYLWILPDGTTSTSGNVVYTFSALLNSNNIFQVVTDIHGCFDSAKQIITGDTIKANFTVDTPICPFAPATFHNLSTHQQNADSSIWLWGDGGRLAQHPITTAQHTYATGGMENVTLIVKNNSCADTMTQAISVYPQPDLHINIPVACNNTAPVTFTPGGSYTGIAWQVNGGSITSSASLSTALNYGTNVITMAANDVHGCRDTVTVLDSVYNMIPGIIYGSNINGLTGSALDKYDRCDSTVQFQARVYTSQYIYFPYYHIYPSPGVHYSWDFGDGTTDDGDTLQSPAHTYHDTLAHTATCTITLANGCVTTRTAHVQVHHPGLASFTASPTTVCRHQAVTFVPHLISGNIDDLQLVWHYTDGGPMQLPTGFGTVTHTFLHPGVFHPYLEVMNGDCSAFFGIHDSIVVDSTWAAINPSFNCANQTEVTFSTSTVHVDSLLWVFGDGTTSTAPTVVHTFPDYGSYNVRLTNYGSASGCRDTNFAVISPLHVRPELYIPDSTFCPGGHNYSLMVGTPDSGFSFDSLYWYRDGVHVLSQEAPSVLEIPERYYYDSFADAGIHTITLAGLDSNGCRDSVSGYIYVANPSAGFASPLIVCGRDTVIFTDTSHDLPNRNLASYFWYFNGIGPDSTDSPTMPHVFTAAGAVTYDSSMVRLVVTDNIGCRDSVQHRIYFSQPKASFSISNLTPCLGVPDAFTNASSSHPSHLMAYLWDFGDGTNASEASPSHAFNTAGYDTVTFTVTDSAGCTDDTVRRVYVSGVTAAIQMDDSVSLCIPFFVNFTAIGTNTDTGALRYIWTIQHATINGPTRYEQYLAPGIDTIRLIDTNRLGCRDTAYAHVRVYGGTGDFYLSTHAGCSPLSVTAGFDLPPTLGIRWFVDATEIADEDTLHLTFVNAGYHRISMLLTDPGGCTSVSVDSVAVDTVLPAIGVAHNTICAGIVDSFTDNSTSLFSTIATTHWDYGDGSSPGSSHTGTHAYATPGTYTVTMTATDALGCSSATTTTSPFTRLCLSR